jgi:hypothetical protein
MLTDKNNCPRTRRRLTDKKIVRGQWLSEKPTYVAHRQRGRVRCPQKLQDSKIKSECPETNQT